LQSCIALAEANEVGLSPVGDAEIEMRPMRDLKETRGAKILVVALSIDIGPEFARCPGHLGLARQIFPALDDRRGKAEIEPEKRGLLGRAFQEPGEYFLARPAMACPDQPRSRSAPRFGDRDTLVTAPLGAGPVDRDIRFKLPHLRFLGRGLA
jgi:hypothetical protein